MPALIPRINGKRGGGLPPPPNLPRPPASLHGRPEKSGVVTEYYYPLLGGICEPVHFFAREARRRGHHVDIITSNIKGAEPQENVIRVGYSQPVSMNPPQ